MGFDSTRIAFPARESHHPQLQGCIKSPAEPPSRVSHLSFQEAGYTLLASFGDQWSDLTGEHAALANFKLPNPMYYLL